jgi:hypothetical protein
VTGSPLIKKTIGIVEVAALAKRRDPRRYHGYAANKMLAQVIVERTNLFGLRDHEIVSLSLV